MYQKINKYFKVDARNDPGIWSIPLLPWTACVTVEKTVLGESPKSCHLEFQYWFEYFIGGQHKKMCMQKYNDNRQEKQFTTLNSACKTDTYIFSI